MTTPPREPPRVSTDEALLDTVRRLHRRLRDRDERIALAESCTGGLGAAAVTALDGASDVFEHAVVAYADRAKIEHLDVPPQTLLHTGAVSGPTARAMAVGVRDRLAGTDWGVSITGLAGPAGGRPGKPVGTVYIGLAGAGGSAARRYRFDGDRSAIRHQSVRAALELALDGIAQPEDASKRSP